MQLLGRAEFGREWMVLATLCALAGAATRGEQPCTKAANTPPAMLEPSARQIRRAVRITCAPSTCALAESLALDVWSEQHGADTPFDIVVTDEILAKLAEAGISWQTLVPDIDAVVDAEAARLRDPWAQSADFFGEYRDYKAISQHIHALAESAPDIAQIHGIGSSIENRTLWALRIEGKGPATKPILINGTQHAREWIAAMTTTCVADRLVRDYATNPEIRDFVDRTELWIVPVVNPDGYQYSWTASRYWRKNRRDRHGVDLNRNFSVAWGGPGSSRSEGSEIYRGAYAFSEPESAALRDLTKREGFAAHIDFHAYGQLVLYPWGHTATPAPDRDRFRGVGDRIASAMFAEHETRYALMDAVELYPASGIMTDWMYGEGHAMSYTIELRPKGGSGFVLPPEQIRPTCDEGLAALLALRAAQ